MNEQLRKTSVKELLYEGAKDPAILFDGESLNTDEIEYAHGTVVSESLGVEMSLIGFIPYSVAFGLYQFSMYINFNDTLVVTPYFIRFSQSDVILPIFQKVSLANNKKYVLDESITICTLQEEKLLSGLRNKVTKLPYVSGESLKNVFNRIKDKSMFEVGDADSIFYIARNNEFVLEHGFGGVRYITNDFLCLCNYMNKVTGLPSYVVLSSHDTLRVLKKDYNPEKKNSGLANLM